jgi:hypothetical protein
MDFLSVKCSCRLIGLAVLLTAAFALCGCPRKQTILDDRPLEKRPHVETEEPVDRSDPFRP